MEVNDFKTLLKNTEFTFSEGECMLGIAKGANGEVIVNIKGENADLLNAFIMVMSESKEIRKLFQMSSRIFNRVKNSE